MNKHKILHEAIFAAAETTDNPAGFIQDLRDTITAFGEYGVPPDTTLDDILNSLTVIQIWDNDSH